MIRTRIAAAALVAVAGVVGPATPAQAAECVGPNEWSAAPSTDPPRHYKGQVHAIFDFDGSQVWQDGGEEVRQYRTCSGSPSFRRVKYRFLDGWAGDKWYAVDRWSVD